MTAPQRSGGVGIGLSTLLAQDIGKVPCAGCTRCCRGDAVRLLPADDASSYLTEPPPWGHGHLMLAHKRNGECIYLTNTGCGIHDRSPQQCREMDCRLIAQRLNYTQAKKVRGLKIEVWHRGRELLRANAQVQPTAEPERSGGVAGRLQPVVGRQRADG